MRIVPLRLLESSKLKNIIFLIAYFLVSCSTKIESKYEYNGNVVYRLDTDGKTCFTYDNCEIFAEYSGINDGFHSYIHFGKNGIVTIYIGDGYMYKKNSSSKFKLVRDLIIGDLDSVNVFQNYFPIEYEKNFNSKSRTKVKSTILSSRKYYW